MLPETLQELIKDVEARKADWEYGDIVDIIKRNLECGERRTPDLLIALAWYQFEFADCVMVDGILSAAKTAASLLEEAGLDNLRITRFRANILKTIRREERALARAGKLELIPEDKLTISQMKELGAWLADQSSPQQLERASALYLLLAERDSESERYHGTRFCHFARAAIYLARSGFSNKALELLEQTVNWPDELAARNYDNCISLAYEQLLIHASRNEDLISFDRIWWRAVERLRTFGRKFPTVFPVQENMLELALEKAQTKIVSYLLNVISSRDRPVSSRTQKLIDQAKRLGFAT